MTEPVNSKFLFLIPVTAALIAGCSKEKPASSSASKQTETPIPASSGPTIEACKLLTKEGIASVLGEEVKETKELAESEGGFRVSVCLFVMPTMANSVTLRLVQRAAGAEARDPRQVWSESYAADRVQEYKSIGREKVEPPEKVAGVGEEAYWRKHPKGGALYVLKGNVYLRLSLTESGNPEDARKKCAALAEMALKNL